MKINHSVTCSLLAALALALSPAPLSAKDSSALEMAQQLNQAFTEVSEKVASSVVVITVTQNAKKADESDESELNALPPEWRRFFEERGGRRRGNPDQPAPRSRGQGSGIVLTEDGYILTNNHVVEDADKINVRFQNGKHFAAEVVGRDPQSDVAVIKIKDGKGFTPAKLADSAKTRVGEFVLAIGAPFDLDYTVTVGHVSAKGRAFGDLGGYADQDFIQTDASINPGNSGGPLVNLAGEVVGINTMIRGIGTGIGFAVPSNLAKRVADHLMKDGKLTRSRIGVGIDDLRSNADFRDQFPGVNDGVIITGIMDDGPAKNSELRAGDIVIAVDGKAVRTSRELKEEVAYKTVGNTITLDVVRADEAGKTKKFQTKVKTEAIPDDLLAVNRKGSAAPADETASLGLTVRALTPEVAAQYDLETETGVIVTAVQADSLASDKGLRPGDVITEVNRTPVKNLREFREALRKADTKRGVILNFVSKGMSRFVILKDE